MTESRKNEIIAEFTDALQERDYDKFLSYFAENAVFEIPFTVNGGIIHKGLPEIKKYFGGLLEDPASKLIRIEEIMEKSYHSGDTVIVEYFTKGRTVSSGAVFHIQSGIAFVRFDDSKIIHYKDIPNTVGIAEKAGVLDQLAASLTRQ